MSKLNYVVNKQQMQTKISKMICSKSKGESGKSREQHDLESFLLKLSKSWPETTMLMESKARTIY